MNTLNFTKYEYNENDWIEIIFKNHSNLVWKYNEFEPNKVEEFDINTYQDQQILKDFLQIRFIEELTEAFEDFSNKDHFFEEIIDAFNFLLAAYIIYGYSSKDLPQWEESIPNNQISNIEGNIFWDIVQKVGITCNHLKNRPWRKSQYLVDLYSFEPKFKSIWKEFNKLCNYFNISKKKLFEQWSLKYQVNMFRIESEY